MMQFCQCDDKHHRITLTTKLFLNDVLIQKNDKVVTIL